MSAAGQDVESCGRSASTPCRSLDYLMQEHQRSATLHSRRNLHLVTDTSITIDGRSKVGHISFSVADPGGGWGQEVRGGLRGKQYQKKKQTNVVVTQVLRISFSEVSWIRYCLLLFL